MRDLIVSVPDHCLLFYFTLTVLHHLPSTVLYHLPSKV